MKNPCNNDRIERSGVVTSDAPCVSPIEDDADALDFSAANREEARVEVEDRSGSQSSSSISSIGNNSDESSRGGGDGEEVQSEYKGAFASLDALEEVLPVNSESPKYSLDDPKSNLDDSLPMV